MVGSSSTDIETPEQAIFRTFPQCRSKNVHVSDFRMQPKPAHWSHSVRFLIWKEQRWSRFREHF
jgi:hypothetical protein